ncbi:MAG TPA: histidine--tRNA ligase, partial [Ilumatobacter sp.]
MPSFQTSPGMRDIVAPESARFRRFTEVFAEVVEPAGYRQIIPPMMEDLGVFTRLGDATDIVTKEMYDFVDKGGRHVALRPEQTASVCRAYVETRPTTPWKTWYSGPNFRYEKPQRGRFRQFDQVGIEVLGADDPYLDVEVIALAWDFFQRLGLQQVTLVVNSLGEPDDRARYVDALRRHFEAAGDALSEQSRETLNKNPLRVLDSKRREDASIIAAAPTIDQFWSEDAAAHFATVRSGLDELAVPYAIDMRLVRG